MESFVDGLINSPPTDKRRAVGGRQFADRGTCTYLLFQKGGQIAVSHVGLCHLILRPKLRMSNVCGWHHAAVLGELQWPSWWTCEWIELCKECKLQQHIFFSVYVVFMMSACFFVFGWCKGRQRHQGQFPADSNPQNIKKSILGISKWHHWWQPCSYLPMVSQ